MIFFGNFNFQITFLLKLGPIFEDLAKLGKASWDAYNQGRWLILYNLLKNWIAEGVASKDNDSTHQHLAVYAFSKVREVETDFYQGSPVDNE